MCNPTNYYQIGRKLVTRYPEFARHLIQEDQERYGIENQIPKLFKQYAQLRPDCTTKSQRTRQRMEFVAIIVRYADPEAMTSDKKLKKGVRSALAETLQCDVTQISHTLKNVKNYIRIYKDFQIAVEYLYSELFNS